MADPWTRRVAGIRLLVLGAVVAQVLTWFANLVLFPSVTVAVVAAITGVRHIRRDDDAAVLRLGVALLASLVASGLALLSGSLVFLLVAWTSSGLFLEAWRRTRVVATERRRAWGIKHQDIVDRRIALEQRRDALRDRPRD